MVGRPMSSGNGQVRVLARSWPQATQGERPCLTAGRGSHAVHGGKRKRFNGGVRERLARGLGRPQRRASLRRPRGRRTRSGRRGSGRLPPGDTVCTCNNGRTFTVAFAADCGGGRLRARQRGFEGAEPPAFFSRRSPAREPRAEEKQRVGPLRGQSLQGWL